MATTTDARQQPFDSADCPECERRIRPNRQLAHLQLLQCANCEAILIVTTLQPLRFLDALEYAIEAYDG